MTKTELSYRVTAREVISSPFSASFIIPTVFGVIIVLSAFAFPDTVINGISLHWADLISAMSALGTFALAKLIHQRNPETPFRGPWLWITAGLLSVLLPQVIISVITGGISIDYISLSIPGYVTYPLVICLLGYIVTSGLKSRAKIRQLSIEKIQLLMMRDSLDEEIATIQSELRQLVESRLSVLFSEITERFTSENLAEIKRSAEQLRESIDLVVRPLSKELALEQSELQSTSERFTDKDVYLTEFLARKVPRRKDISLSLQQLLSLPFILLPSVVFIVPALSSVFGVEGALRGIATLVILGIVLFVVKRTAGNFSGRPTALIFIATGGIALVTYLVSSALWGIESPLRGSFAITICVALIALGQMLLKYFQLRRNMSITESEETNIAIDLLLSRLRQEVWVIRKKLAQVVHGQVQSRLLAASMRLSQNEHLDAETLDRAKADIVAAMSAVATGLSENEESFTDQFQRIQDAWDGVCVVTLSAPAEALELLEFDSLARTCVAEVIGEAVANAAKHSRAARVDVTLTHNPGGFIDVIITTSGELEIQSCSQSGYGSRILDDLTTSWQRTGAQGLITLTAQIALDPAQN